MRHALILAALLLALAACEALQRLIPPHTIPGG